MDRDEEFEAGIAKIKDAVQSTINAKDAEIIRLKGELGKRDARLEELETIHRRRQDELDHVKHEISQKEAELHRLEGFRKDIIDSYSKGEDGVLGGSRQPSFPSRSSFRSSDFPNVARDRMNPSDFDSVMEISRKFRDKEKSTQETLDAAANYFFQQSDLFVLFQHYIGLS